MPTNGVQPGAIRLSQTDELAGLATIGVKLHHAGEGGQVVWGIGITAPEMWVRHESDGRAVAQLELESMSSCGRTVLSVYEKR